MFESIGTVLKAFVFSLLSLLGFVSNPSVQKISSIHEIKSQLESVSQETWVIFDVDDTLTYKASNIIFQPWFRKTEVGKRFRAQLIKHGKSQEDPRVYQLHVLTKRMIDNVDQPIELGVVNLIKTLQGRGLTVIALTKCITGFVDGTLIQKLRYEKLLEVDIDFSSSFEEQEIIFDDLTSSSGRNPMFYKGILFTDEFTKGQTLGKFLDVMKLKPKKVIFIDDNEDYISSVRDELAKRGIEFQGYHYRAADNLNQEIDPKIIDYQLEYLKKHNEIISDEKAREAVYSE